MKQFSSVLLLAVALIVSATAEAQVAVWQQPMADNTVNFYTIQQQANQHFRRTERELSREAEEEQSRGNASKGAGAQGDHNEAEFEGYFQYKRWEDFMAPRVYPSGDISLPSHTWENFNDYMANNSAAAYQYQRGQGGSNQRLGPPGNSIQSSTWTFVGPTGAPTGSGAGRVNFLRFDPTNTNILWCGAPAGGLWKSTNGGTSWTTNTDFLAVIGATDVVIDPTNTQIMYLATGDGDAGDTYSIGVLKSIDGGSTWNTTGLTWTVNQGRVISKLLINPTTPSIIMAFTNNGIYRTTDSGASWTQVQNANAFKDAEFQPGTPNTVYACGTTFWKSTNGGATWAAAGTGLPAAANVDRFAIAVTANQTGYVYLLAGSAANDGFYGFYRSTDNGATFTQRSSTPNVLGWASAGNDTGGQGWYDLAVDADPTNANNVIVGGVNVWRSTNGGTNWTLNAHWTGTGAPYIHADVHSLNYLPGSGTTYFATSDGGVFKTTNNGTTWADLSNNLCIAQPYRIGLSASSQPLFITGHQDNGTNIHNATYVGTMGGDGMDCFIDRTNNNVMYGEQYNGSLNRTTNGGGSWTAINTGLAGNAAWVTPWYQDPTTANTIYCGRTTLYRSTNQGTNWTAVASAVPGAGTIVDFKIAPSNNQIIYVVKSNAVYKTINAGAAWTTVTGTLPVGSAAISRVDVKPSDPNTVIVTFSGYSSGNKVFRSTNGGTSWTNISTGLPNLPCNCVRYDASSAVDGVYVGCDVGVYYMDNSFSTWQPYFISLPNVPIFDLEVYGPGGKLRAATYGRGVWEVDVYNPGTLAPIADFSANYTTVCAGNPVNFTDLSSFTPTSWAWTFQGGTPATSTAQNPTGITWSTPGTYSVSLTATNGNGSDNETKLTYITVLAAPTAPPLVEGFVSTTFVPTNWSTLNINNDGIFWTRTTTAGIAPTAGNCAMFDNYNLDVAGARDEMRTPRQNLSAASTVTMTFDVAYARYDATYTDTLEVVVSTDCGVTWTQAYIKGGTTLATVPDQTTLFTPTAAQWRSENVNLNAFAGQGSVIIAFRNRGHYGNALYVDNVNLTQTTSALPSGTFTMSATSVCAGTPVSFTDNSTNSPTSWTWTFPSGTPASATTQNVASVVWNTAGTYTVTHTATNASGTGTTTQTITVLATPTVTTTATPATICVGSSSSLAASGASTYNWMPGSLSGTPVSVSPAATTTYTVTGTAANGCTSTATRTITVNGNPTVTATASSPTICSGNSTNLTGSGATTYSWMPGSLSGTTVSVSPATTTTYTVTGTNAAGCTATQTVLVTVNPTPTVTVSASQSTICSGSSTTLTASGGTTYSWMPGSLTGTSVVVSPGTTTTYTVTGTTSGCSGTATQLITVNSTPTVTASASAPTICSGNSTTLTGTGASTYGWNPGALSGSPVTVSPGTTTTYTMTGTAANGCTATQTVAVTVNPSPTVTATAGSPTICVGGSTTLTGGGASTYAWNPGSLSGSPVTVSPATTTTYTATGTAANGCTGTQTVMVTVNPTPTVAVSATQSTICAGSSTTMTASGATTYTWMPGSLSGTSVVVSPATTTTYTVTGTSGCTDTETITITVNSSPTVTASASAPTICSGSSTTLTGTGASTYSWNPGALSGSPVSVTPASTTTYTVTGTAANGCTATQTVAVTVNPSPTVTAIAGSPTICVGGSTTLTGGGASTYAWNPGSLSGSPVTVSPAATTTYTATGTAANGCTGTQTVMVTVNPTPTVAVSATQSTICAGSSTTMTASGATTYTWMPGSLSGTSVVVSPATTTTYTVTGTSGCTDTETITITVNSSPTVSASASPATICSGSSTTLTGTGASTYSWNPGALSGSPVSVTPASTTTYTVTGTAVNGCTATQTVAVTVNASPTVTATTSNSSICTGGSTTLTGNGASTYNWMPGSLSGTSVVVTPASTTTYTVNGTAVNGCVGTNTIVITVGSQPTVTATASSTSICNGSSTTLTGSGTTSYTWMPGSLSGTSVVVSPAATTTYTVTGSNGPGCTNTATITITVNSNPTVTASASSTTICSGNSTTLTGSGASTYVWNPGALSGSPVTVSPAATTTYTVTGTSAAGCTGTATRTITVNPSPTVTASASSTSVCAGGSTTLTGSGASTYSWMPGSLSGTSVVVTPASTTTYTVNGTAANGCVGTNTIVITVGPPPTVTASASNASICTGGSTTLTGSGATTYTWMPGSLSGTSVVVTPASTTTYTVTGSNGPGCTNTATVTITVNPNPTVTASASSATICVGSSTTLTGGGASTYVWNPGALSGSPVTVSPAATTTYTVTGTSAAGCTGTATRTITVNPLPSLTVTPTAASICPGGSVSISCTPVGTSSFAWTPTAGLSAPTSANTNASPVATTTYVVTKTNVNGCTRQGTVVITVNPSPTITATAGSASICAGGSTTLTGSGANTYTWMPGSLSGTTVTVTPAATTTYTVTGTNASGCTSTQTVTVTVGPPPTVTASSSGAICAGGTATLTASGASTYTWMPGSLSGNPVSVSPAATTTYTVTGSNGPGCSNTATISVVVNSLPTVSASASSTTTCSGNTVTLTGSGASTYSWMPGSLSGSSVVTNPTSSTTYTVTGTAANGCSNTGTVAITVNALPTVTASVNNDTICSGNQIMLSGSGASTYSWMPGSLSGSPVNDTPPSSTTYTVTGTDANGCTSTGTVAITVNALPNVTASSSSGTTCAGNQITLTGSGAATYMWMPGALSGSPVTDNPTSSTTYTVTGTDVNGCTNTGTVAVNVNSLPSVSVSLPQDTFCNIDGPIALSGGSPIGGNYSGPGVTSNMFDASSVGLGNYSIVYTYNDVNGCTDSASQMVVVDVCNSNMDSVDNVALVSVIPNPNNGDFILSFNVGKPDDYVLEIHNALGQVIYSEELKHFSGVYQRDISLSSEGRGSYTVRLRSSTKESVIRVITY